MANTAKKTTTAKKTASTKPRAQRRKAVELTPATDVATNHAEQPLRSDNLRPVTLPIDLPPPPPSFPEAVNDNLAADTLAELRAALPRTKREWALFVGGGFLVAGFIVGFLWAFPAAGAAFGLN